MRKGGSHGNGDLTGTYHLGSFFYDSDVARDDSAWGSMTLGGDGMASGNVQFNIDGSVISPVSTSLPPGVASGGTVTATFATLEFTGTVLAGGELIILAGSTTSTEAPMLLALIRGQPAPRQPFGRSVPRRRSRSTQVPCPRWTSIASIDRANGVNDVRDGGRTANQDGAVAPALISLLPINCAVAAGGGLFYGGGSTLLSLEQGNARLGRAGTNGRSQRLLRAARNASRSFFGLCRQRSTTPCQSALRARCALVGNSRRSAILCRLSTGREPGSRAKYEWASL